MLVFGILLVLLSVCNSQPQNVNGNPPLDTDEDSTSKLRLFREIEAREIERIKRNINQGDNSTSNSSLSPSNSNSSSQSSSSSPNVLVTDSHQPSHLSIASQTTSSNISQDQDSSSTLPLSVSSTSSNVQISSSPAPDSSGDGDVPHLSENDQHNRASSGRSLNGENNSGIIVEGSGDNLNVEGQEVEGSSQANLNSSDINVANSTVEESLEGTNSTNITVSDDQELDNDGTTSNQNQTATDKLELQTQIYIVSGTLGGVILLLILLVLALALAIARIKDQLQDRHQKYIPAEISTNPSRGYRAEDNVNTSYVNDAFNGGHEMEERGVESKTTAERMGYEMYNGRPNAENRNSSTKNTAPIPRARVEIETNSFDSGNRNKHDRRHQTSRQQQQYSHTSNHKLRLEEGVSPVHTPRGGANEYDNRDRDRRDRYRDRH